MLVFDSFGQIGTWRGWKCDPKLSWYESMMGQDQLGQKLRKCHHLGPRYDFFTKKISDLLSSRQSNICCCHNACWFHQLVLCWYLHQPEQVKSQKLLFNTNSEVREKNIAWEILTRADFAVINQDTTEQTKTFYCLHVQNSQKKNSCYRAHCIRLKLHFRHSLPSLSSCIAGCKRWR